MADKEAEKPWPLMVTSVIADVGAERAVDPESLLDAHIKMLQITARKKLQEEGRMGDIRSLKLYCYNHDITKEKE